MSFLPPLARQPIEILLAIAAFLGNQEAIGLLRLNHSFWRSHHSPSGRYRLKLSLSDKYFSSRTRYFRPSEWPAKFLSADHWPRGNFLVSGLHMASEEDVAIFMDSLKNHSVSPFSHILHVYWNFHFPLEIPLPLTVQSIEFGPTYNLPIQKLPETIKTIRFGALFNQPVDNSSFPPSLTHLILGRLFDQKIPPEGLPEGLEEIDISLVESTRYPLPKLPVGLKILKLSSRSLAFDRLPPYLRILHLGSRCPPLYSASLPPTLEEIYFHRDFGQTIHMGFFHEGITLIDMGESFNGRLWPGLFPSTLKTLRLGQNFRHPIISGVLPSSLEELILPYNQYFHDIFFTILYSLNRLKSFHLIPGDFSPTPIGHLVNGIRLFGHRLAHFLSISNGIFSEGLESLVIDGTWNFPLSSGIFPSTLKRLEFGNSFDHPIAPAILPPSLRFLKLGDSWNSPLEPGIFPPGIERIEFGRDFNQKLGPGIFPPSVIAIKVGSHFQEEILPGHLPDSLVEFNLSNYYFGYFPAAALPGGIVLDSVVEKKFSHPVDLKAWDNQSNSIPLGRRLEGQRFLVRNLVSLRPRSVSAWNDYYLLEPCEGGESLIVNVEMIDV